jgi:hypothetical protein
MSDANTPQNQPTQSYPMYDLSPSCIEVGQIVANHGGAKAGVHRSQIAAGLHLEEDSSTFSPKLSSARSFGIITGRGEYMLTESGRKLYEPHSETDRRIALLNFLASPLAFSKFIEKYDGSKIPTGTFLANIFQQLGVGKSWAPRVATIFTKAAELAGALDSQGFLRYTASVKNTGMAASMPTPMETSAPSKPNDVATTITNDAQNFQPSKPHTGANVWVFNASGMWVKVETSQDISLELWDRLNKYVQIIKPEKAAT